MAIYRHIQTDIWKDEKVLEDMTPEDKLFLMYLLTNSNTTQIGIYKLSKKQAAFELGYSEESVKVFIDRFENQYKMIRYNNETREIAIKNWGKYNLNKGGKPIIDCVKKELINVKDKSLIDFVIDSISKEEIRAEFIKVINEYKSSINSVTSYNDNNDTYNESLTIGGQKEKEKEKQKEKENKNIKKDDSVDVSRYDYSLKNFKSLYEENIGLINGITSQWLIEVSEEFEYELFRRALEIATNKGKCNKGYVNGILNQWRDINIRSMSDLKAYEISIINKSKNLGGDMNYGCKNDEFKHKDRKYKHATSHERENEKSIVKPSEEQLKELREKYNL